MQWHSITSTTVTTANANWSANSCFPWNTFPVILYNFRLYQLRLPIYRHNYPFRALLFFVHFFSYLIAFIFEQKYNSVLPSTRHLAPQMLTGPLASPTRRISYPRWSVVSLVAWQMTVCNGLFVLWRCCHSCEPLLSHHLFHRYLQGVLSIASLIGSSCA